MLAMEGRNQAIERRPMHRQHPSDNEYRKEHARCSLDYRHSWWDGRSG